MKSVFKKLAALYFLALAVELLFLFLVAKHAGWSLGPYLSGNDTGEYLAIAKNLVLNGAYSKSLTAPFIPTFFRLPGYPFWLALIFFIFHSFKPAIFWGILMFSLFSPLAYLISKEIFSEKLSFLSGLVIALEPRMAFSASFLLTEQVFVPIFLLLVLLVVKFFKNPLNKKFIFIAAFLLGILTLIKTVILYLWPVLIIFFVFYLRGIYSKKEIFKLLFLSTILLIIVISPWLLRNYLVLNTWQLSSTGGLVLYWGHLEILERYLGTPSELAYQNLIDRAHNLAGQDLESVRAADILTKEAAREIKGNWQTYLKIYFFNLPLFFISDGYNGILSYITEIRPNYVNFFDLLVRLKIKELSSGLKSFSLISLTVPIFGRVAWLALTFLSISGIFLSMKKMPQSRPILALLAFLILYFALLTGPIGFDPRYRMPVNAFLIVFAGVTIFKVLKINFSHESF